MTESGDSAARRQALDPARSFIVQAPAGSGKTELLIQRHLSLLSRVNYPEQVVAVTFTRKAAAEMRSRVLDVLELAASGMAEVPEHRRISLELAVRVLERDRELGWGLLERPGRLRIDTVDALNGWLAERLPVASGGMAGAAVIGNPAGVYRRAAIRMLESALSTGQLRGAARTLLAAADNSFETLVRAIAAVIPMRDQWLALAADTDRERIRAALAAGLATLAVRRLEKVRALTGPACRPDLESLVAHVAAYADSGATLPGPGPGDGLGPEGQALSGDIAFWQAIAGIVLTGSGGWRKRLTRREGFLPEHKAQKAQAAAVIEMFSGCPGVREALLDIAVLPALEPADAQVDRAAAALQLLLHAVAELKVIFQQDHAVDFLELALGAQAALGALDQPSELLLALDRRIEHLLVDEFQDTSHSQFRLLELLTAGWTGTDGRTLFLVGDPMQSIYRFRDADMSLFLRARARGIGDIALEPLVLSRNFRSSPVIVDWVNAVFARSFPAVDDPVSGKAAYYAFDATRLAAHDEHVTLHRTAGSDLGAQHGIVARVAVETLAKAPGETVAVLVQSRSHLKGLRTVLDEAGVAVRAVELDTLSEQPAVQDLLALTRALLHPMDRIAWLAVLRAPWCGLSWTDLHTIARSAPEQAIFDLLDDETVLGRLGSRQARERVLFLRERLKHGMRLRGRYPLTQWIECCWQLLDGPATLSDASDFDQVQAFSRVLAEISVDGDVPDTTELGRALDVPYSSSRSGAQFGAPVLDIMTIHRAKGLEFDTVVLFGLDKRVRGADSKVLYWQSLRADEDAGPVLFAAMNAAGDPLISHLQAVDRELDRAERGRLLYVAVTRARRRLHLVGHLADSAGAETATVGTLMWWLAEQFSEAPFAPVERVPEAGDGRPDQGWIIGALNALDFDADAPAGPLAPVDEAPVVVRPEYEWASVVAAHIGTVVHRALQRWGTVTGNGDDRAARFVDADALDGYARELQLLGVPRSGLTDACERVRDILERVAADRFGRWVLGVHAQAQSEYELAVAEAGRVFHMRIDRTFVDDDGVRWIIDYKTSRHAGGDKEPFLDSEVERYRPQLEAYARAMYSLDPRPVRVGLYFPLLDAFRDWAPALTLAR